MFDWRTGGCKLVFLSSNEYEDLVPTRLTESLVSSVLFIVVLKRFDIFDGSSRASFFFTVLCASSRVF